MKNNKNDGGGLNVLSKLGVFSLSLLITASAVYLYSPVIKSHADTDEENLDIAMSISSAIGLSLSSDDVSMSADLNSFVHKSVTASVATNSQYGYTLSLEDTDSNTNMTHQTSGITDVIAASSYKRTTDQLVDNTWGYSTDNTYYYGVPVSGSPVALKNTTTPIVGSSDDTVVDFGIKVGILTSGTYQDTVLFTAYSNGPDGKPENGTEVGEPTNEEPAEEPSGGEEISATMQDFTCSDKEAGFETVLRDSRDGDVYNVKKLLDGKCWMTQNLRIGKDTAMTLTSAESDSNADFELPASDINTFTTTKTSKAIYIDSTYGGYYNFNTATSGLGGTYSSYGAVGRSICPKNWKIPTKAEFQALYNNYPDNSLVEGAPSFNLPGNIFNKNPSYQGTRGWYWSSTNKDANNVYRLYLNESGADNSSTSTKDYGYNIRCVARN